MYIFADKLYKKDEIELTDTQKQIIFASIDNEKIINWLRDHRFPESFIEDIQNENQTITHEENETFRLTILKYFRQHEENKLLYEAKNIVLILTDMKFIFLSKDEKIIQGMTEKLYKRYEPSDTIEYIMYTVIDILIDDTMSIIDFIDDKLEEIEDNIFKEEINEQNVQKSIYFARRSLNRIEKLSVQENDVVNKIFNHLTVPMRKKLTYEFIDLKEHLSFLINESKNHLDRTDYLQSLLMEFLNNRMNQAMQRLAAISLIFLPLTFIVGNYGMNFRFMPELEWEYAYLGIWGLNIAIAYLVFRWLKKKQWI